MPINIPDTLINVAGIATYETVDVIAGVVALVVLLCVFRRLFKRKRQSWRVAASRRWLKTFRAHKDNFSPAQRFSYLRKVDHFLFEDVLMSCFEERGYVVRRTPATRDGGIDGFVFLNGKHIAVQAKRYAGRINKQHVKDLEFVVVNTPHLEYGLFVHTGRSSGPILTYVSDSPHVELLSGVEQVLNFLDGKPMILFRQLVNGVTN